MDLTKIYPYVVPQGYVDATHDDQDGFTLPLGHNVFVQLWEFEERVAQYLHVAEFTQINLDAADAHALAMRNLETLAAGDAITRQFAELGGSPVIMMGEHWLAASCIRLPGLWEWARSILKTNDICASIPTRETLLLFPMRDPPFRHAMRNLITRAEESATKPITFELFQLVADGIVPLVDS
jgi:hypothetical protein